MPRRIGDGQEMNVISTVSCLKWHSELSYSIFSWNVPFFYSSQMFAQQKQLAFLENLLCTMPRAR